MPKMFQFKHQPNKLDSKSLDHGSNCLPLIYQDMYFIDHHLEERIRVAGPYFWEHHALSSNEPE